PPGGAPAQESSVTSFVDLPYREAKERAIHAFETSYFAALLQRAGGNVSEAARQAGLDRSNFRRAAKRAGLKTRDDDWWPALESVCSRSPAFGSRRAPRCWRSQPSRRGNPSVPRRAASHLRRPQPSPSRKQNR